MSIRTGSIVAVVLLFACHFTNLPTYSQATLSGFIQDASTREALIGANVVVKETKLGAASNLSGYYVIPALPVGTFELAVSYVGYETHMEKITVAAEDKLVKNFLLQPSAIALKGVTATATQEDEPQDINLAQVSVTTREMQTMARVVEADVFRSLQFLPGVIAPSDFSTGLVVRGGNTDQNLITLDGITVYNPSHVGGLFSNFITEALKEANLMKGGFPAEYGGRISSVLRLTSREGNSQKFSGSASISLLSSQSTLEGPVGKGAWLLSLRRTYIDQILNAARSLSITDFELPYYFYDVQGHVFQDLSHNDRISFSTYLGRDVLDWEDLTLDLNWGNRTYAVNWRHLFSQRVFSNFMLASSRFDTKVGVGNDGGLTSLNEIVDHTAKGDLTYFITNAHELKFGFEAKDLRFSYENEFEDRDLGSILQEPSYFAAYAQDSWRPSLRWVIQPGVRLSYFSRATEKTRFEPRFSAKYLVGAKSALSLSYGQFNQYISTVQDELNPSFIDFWFAFDETVPPAKASHYILGYDTELPWHGLQLNVEGYYKDMFNLLAFKETRSSVTEELDFTIVNIFRRAKGEAYGGEIYLRKPLGRLNGWLGYSFAHVYKDGVTINDVSTRYPPNWDRRHALNIVANYNLSRKWELSALFKYGSGFPYTQANGSFEYDELGTPIKRRVIFDEINGARYPAYHRLDLSLTRHYYHRTWQMDLFLNLVNVYNRQNVFYYMWDFDEDPAKRDTIPLFPFLPSIGVSAKF
ncbi:TonB-dependent receptor [candidate division KSB1 bacterium]|nr:TonB-dependent receptor [candidate division KSB1 bacterium]